MRQRAEIVWELEETVVVMRGSGITTEFCPRCRSRVEMVSCHVLEQLAGSAERDVLHAIEAGDVHSIEQKDVLACISCCQRVITVDLAAHDKNSKRDAIRKKKERRSKQ